LVPSKEWLSHGNIDAPQPLNANHSGNRILLQWEDAIDNDSRFFIIYSSSSEMVDVQVYSENIIARIWREPDETNFEIEFGAYDPMKQYYISAVNQAGIESGLAEFTID